MEKLFVPIMLLVITVLIVSIVYIIAGVRHRERMAWIERGLNPEQIPKVSGRLEILKWGMFLIGSGLGFLCAFIIDQFVLTQMESTEPLFPSLTAIFGGISLVLFYKYFSKKKLTNNELNDYFDQA